MTAIITGKNGIKDGGLSFHMILETWNLVGVLIWGHWSRFRCQKSFPTKNRWVSNFRENCRIIGSFDRRNFSWSFSESAWPVWSDRVFKVLKVHLWYISINFYQNILVVRVSHLVNLCSPAVVVITTYFLVGWNRDITVSKVTMYQEDWVHFTLCAASEY